MIAGRARFLLLVPAVLWIASCAGRTPPPAMPEPAPPAAQPRALPPVSGLGCLPDGSLLAVVDTKNNAPMGAPRVVRVRLSDGESSWEPVAIDWPGPDGASNDLEGVAAVPGTDSFLLVESSYFQGRFGRIFQVSPQGDLLRSGKLPTDVDNIEGVGVAEVGGRLVFLFGERGNGTIRWADLDLSGTGIALGESRSVRFQTADPQGPNHREISALEVDGEGHLFAVSTIDPGDRGPFQSVLWEIGEVEESEGTVAVTLLPEPRRIADVPDSKVEALTFCQGGDGSRRLFLGTDDEEFGGSIRPLPDVN
ncbi:MAG: hypothetical protein ACLGI9_15485 [Thermoanaerobaculia bacterium]